MSDEASPIDHANAAQGMQVTGVEVVAEIRVLDRAAYQPADAGALLLHLNAKYFPAQSDARLATERSRRDVATRIDYHLSRGQWDMARRFLTSFTFLAARLALTGISALLEDFRRALSDVHAESTEEIRTVHDVLTLIAHILDIAPSQLPEQLLARLPPGRGERIDAMRHLAEQYKKAECRLRPQSASFTGPGEGLRRVLEQHRSTPSAVTFSKDGAVLYSADSNEILVWDTATYEVRARLVGHAEELTHLVVASDNRFIVAAGRSQHLFCWAVSEGDHAERLLGRGSNIRGLAALPNGDVLSVDSDGALLAWMVFQKRSILLGNLPKPVRALALYPDASCCVVASAFPLSGPSTLTVWDLAQQRAIRSILWKTGDIDAVSISGDCRFALVASNKALFRWKLPEWDGPEEFGHHSWKIAALSSDGPGQCAVSADTGGNVQVQSLCDEAAAHHVLSGHRMVVNAVAVSSRGELATAGFDRTVRIWDFPPKLPSGRSRPHQKAVTSLAAWSWQGKMFVLSASEDQTLALWSLDALTEERRLVGHSHWVSDAAIVPERGWAVSASWDGTIRVWDLLGSGAPLLEIRSPEPHLQAVAIDRTGRRIASAPFEGPVRLWDLASGIALDSQECNIGRIASLAFTPDGNRLIAGGGSGMVCLNVANDVLHLLGSFPSLRTVRNNMAAENSPADAATDVIERIPSVHAIALFPDGYRSLIATATGKLFVWDCLLAQSDAPWQDSPSGIADVAISATGRWAVTVGGRPYASSDDTVRVWDCTTGRVIARFIGDVPLNACCISNDDRRIVVGDKSGMLHVFSLDGVDLS